jgi:hypothetical protein
MAEVVLRVRLTSGDHIDVRYDEPDTAETDEVVEHVISNLTEDSGVLRSRHGDGSWPYTAAALPPLR